MSLIIYLEINSDCQKYERKGQRDKNQMISVIVPVYNTEKYLRECIESIINQTYKNLEIILVDDGSKDLSFKIISEFAKKDERIKVFHKENSGVSATRNFGLSCAKGDLISFCDSDDVLVASLYETLLKYMEIENTDRVCGGYKYLYPNRRKVYSKPRIVDGYYSKQEILSMMIDNGTLSGFMFSGVNNCLFRKSIIDKYNIRFHENIKYNEDSLFSFEYALHSKGIYSLGSIPLYLYRQHSESTTGKKILCDKYSQVNEFLQNMNLDIESINFDIQMKRRVVTIALWDIIDISKCLSGTEAIKMIKATISSNNVRENLRYIEKKKLNRYKSIYFFLMKHKMALLLYMLTKWVMPVASRYLSR